MACNCDDPPPDALLEGIEQFNRGEFFEQHETLERLWRKEKGEMRYLYQGILQLGVAMYHVQQGNHHGAVSMLKRGKNYLEPFSPHCQSVDINDLLEQATKALTFIEHLGKNNLGSFDWKLAPRVNLIG